MQLQGVLHERANFSNCFMGKGNHHVTFSCLVSYSQHKAKVNLRNFMPIMAKIVTEPNIFKIYSDFMWSNTSSNMILYWEKKVFQYISTNDCK